MPRYLLKANYSAEGAAGVLSSGGVERRNAVTKAAESVGGKLVSFDFAFGSTDAYVIVELPDNSTAAAMALTVSSSGRAHVETVVLIPPEDVVGRDLGIEYTPPGAT